MDASNKKVLLTLFALSSILLVFLFISTNIDKYLDEYFFAVISLFLFSGFYLCSIAGRERKWIETRAIINTIEEDGELVAISRYTKIKYFYPKIVYHYYFNGVCFTSNVVSFRKKTIWVPEFSLSGLPTVDKRWWLPLKPGQEIIAFVNPKNPKNAVLRKGQNVYYIQGFFLIGIAIFLIFVSFFRI